MTGIVISGASGQLGKSFLRLLSFREEYSVYSFDRNQLDISDRAKIQRILLSLPQVQYWINCAAYTRVDDAETHHREATLYNTIAPGYIATACREAGVHYFDFSSDYVYHNGLQRPLREDDPTAPKGIYAQTKLEGEIEISVSGASYTILRTSWVYGPGGHNFVNTMLRLGQARDRVRVVGDQLGAPTFTDDIVWAVKELIRQDLDGKRSLIHGIFNFSNAGEVTWADFAKSIFKFSGSPCEVEIITTDEYEAAAPRPAYSVLNCEKISRLLTGPIPHWEDGLRRYMMMQR